MTPREMIKLPITAGTLPLSRTILANFIFVDCPSAYNVVMGRPILVELRAVVSIHHLMIKFPSYLYLSVTDVAASAVLVREE